MKCLSKIDKLSESILPKDNNLFFKINVIFKIP